jgi:hypothetical protein
MRSLYACLSGRQGYRIFCRAIFAKMMFDLPGNISIFQMLLLSEVAIS